MVLYKKMDIAMFEQMEEVIEKSIGLNRGEWEKFCDNKMSLGEFLMAIKDYIFW